MLIHLEVLGGLRLTRGNAPMDALLGQRSRTALLVYLAVERAVSRESLATVFWPESDGGNARHALRQSLYQLRRTLGSDCIAAHAHELRAGAHVWTDVGGFDAALERADPEGAARLYAGPFMHGVNLIDLTQWENWVDARRARYAREFRHACRAWVDARRAAGDIAGAIVAARHWVAPDPLDDEAQHQLIEVLAEAGERTEAIRQYENYARLLQPDSLRPLDHTVELVKRLRTQATPRSDAPNVQGEPRTRTQPGVVDGEHAPGSAQASWPDASLPPAREATRPGAHASRAGPLAPHARPRSLLLRPTHALATGGVLIAVVMGALRLAEPRILLHPRNPGADVARESGERVILAEFRGPADDPTLGAVVTDALRMDLLQTQLLRVVDPAAVRQSLRRMRLPDDTRVMGEVAREVALREGIDAMIDGEIARAGTGYVLTAQVRSTATDRIMAAFRETATGPDDVIAAIDRLSRQIRQRAGETLSSTRTTPQLARLTTASLEALRVYADAERAFQRSDYRHASALLEEAVRLDPEFAMAWRLLATTLANTRWDPARQIEAASRAFELRHRLSPRERHLAAGTYHSHVTHNHEAMVDAYRRVLDLYPDDPVALNNLALRHRDLGDFALAAHYFRKAVDRPDPSPAIYGNLIATYLAGDQLGEARRAVKELAARYPDDISAIESRFWTHFRHGNEAAAAALLEPVIDDRSRSPAERSWAHDRMARLALWRGQLDQARGHLKAGERIIRDAGPPYNVAGWRLNRAHAEAMVGDPDRAVRLLEEGREEGLLELNAGTERHYYHQAIVFGMAQRLEDLENVLRIVDTAGLPSARGTTRESIVALLQLHRGDLDDAVSTLQNVRASHPCKHCFAPWMGWVLRDLNRRDEAAAEWEAALAGRDTFDDPGLQLACNLWIMQRLPALHEELGNTDRAVHHYRRFVDLWKDADPEIQPRVEHARQRIAVLTGGTRRHAGSSPRRADLR